VIRFCAETLKRYSAEKPKKLKAKTKKGGKKGKKVDRAWFSESVFRATISFCNFSFQSEGVD
jgi:hypothetical protein